VLSKVKQNVVKELVLWKCGCETSLNLKTLLIPLNKKQCK